MTRWLSITAVGLCLAGSASAQDPERSKPAPADAALDPARLAVLRRDPRNLPRAAERRWDGFGREVPKTESMPSGMGEAFEAVAAGDIPRALSELYRVLDAEPEYPPALYEAGVLYFRLQRYGDAAVVLERFVHVLPERLGDTRVLGHCYYSLGGYARAKEHYGHVLEASPEDVEALRGLALSEMRLGNSARALELLGSVLARQPRHAEAWAWKARILLDEDRIGEAREAAERARDLEPWEPRPWFLLAQILLVLGQEEDGEAAQARYRILDAAAQEARSIESRLRLDPRQTPLLERLVEIHRSTGNIPDARTVLARLAHARPTDVDLRIRTLDVLESMGDGEGARVAAKSLEQVCPEEWKAWKRLETFYARIRDRQRQLEAGERYRRLKPD